MPCTGLTSSINTMGDGDRNGASETAGGATTSYIYDQAGAPPVVLSGGAPLRRPP